MYNRYLNTCGDSEPQPIIHNRDSGEQDCGNGSDYSPNIDREPAHETECGHKSKQPADMDNKPGKSGLLSGISESLTERLSGLHFDMDTLIMIVAVYFLIADSDDFDTELLVIIGVLFVLGL